MTIAGIARHDRPSPASGGRGGGRKRDYSSARAPASLPSCVRAGGSGTGLPPEATGLPKPEMTALGNGGAAGR